MRIHLKCPVCFSEKVRKQSTEPLATYSCKECGTKWSKEQVLCELYKAIETIHFEIGAWDSENIEVSIDFIEKTVLYKEGRFSREDPTKHYLPETKLREAMEVLKSKVCLLEWKKEYFDEGILDGIQWKIQILFQTPLQPLCLSGSNAFPKQWQQFSNFLTEITNSQYNYDEL